MKGIILWLVALSIVLVSTRASHTTDEWRNRTIYQIITDRFARTDGSTQPCNDLTKYWGGTFKGIEKNLDYIKNMGFDAIWISPISLGNNYNGYETLDWYKINPYFGTEEDLRSLIKTMHSKDMWLMLDVVTNHVASIDMAFELVNPFNKTEHYHKKCQINNWDDEIEVENCRILNLPDLDQDNSFVRSTLKSWIKDTIVKYDIDGIRVANVKCVKKEFWKEYTQSAGCFALGETIDANVDNASKFQGYVPALLNYPMYFMIRKVWKNAESMKQLKTIIETENVKFKDVTVLGTFTDEHDYSRFLDGNNDLQLYKSALTFMLYMQGIPIVYYGTEQAFKGGNSPNNREPLWTSMNTSSEMYKFITTIVQTRKKHEVWKYPHIERYVNDNFYAFSRGDLLIATTNTNSRKYIQVSSLPESYKEGTIVCNIFDPRGDCLSIMNGALSVMLFNGETKIYIPQNRLVDE